MRGSVAAVFAALLVVLALTQASSRAQAPKAQTISLAEILQHAVRHSPELASATIDVRIAEANALQAAGIEDWLLGANLSYFRRSSEAAAGNVIGTDSTERLSGEISLSKLLWTGGTVSVIAEAERSDNVFAFGGGTEVIEKTNTVTLALDQPLLRGRGEKFTRATQTQAELTRRAEVLAREQTARLIIRDLIVAYWELAYAINSLDIRRESLTLAQERRRLTEASVQAGATAPTEVVAVDQVIASREEEILAAELQIVERSLELRALAGLEIGPGAVELSATPPAAVDATAFDLRLVLEKAVAESPEIAALEVRGEGAKLEVEITDNGLLPSLDLRVFGGPTGTDNKWSRASEEMATFGSYLFGADLTLQHSLGNQAAKGAHQRAMAQRELVLVDMADIRRQVARSAAQAVALANTARKSMALSERAIELSEKNIEAETGRFELGKSTNFDVLARQEELKQARLRYARALTDYLRAQAFLAALTGEILPSYGVAIE